MKDYLEIPDTIYLLTHPDQRLIAGNPAPEDEQSRNGLLVFTTAEEAVSFAAENCEGWAVASLSADDLADALRRGIREGMVTDGFVWFIGPDGASGGDMLDNLPSDDPSKCSYCGSGLIDAEKVRLVQPFTGRTVKGRAVPAEIEILADVCRVCGRAPFASLNLPLDPDMPAPPRKARKRRRKR